MNSNPAAAGIGAVLLDIEGTTTPVAFVTQVLFPYARKHLRAHLEQHARSSGYEVLFTRLCEEHASALRLGEAVPAWVDEPQSARLAAIATYAEWLMDRDRKSPALKDLQGRIWQIGYERGELVGEVFPDVPRALSRWQDRHVPVGIFSSGSVLAQQLLFRHSSDGDLTPFLRWYFDTQVGAKVEADSYRRIAQKVGLPVESILFLSDTPTELNAARQAGMQVRLASRPGNVTPPRGHDFEVIASFEDLANCS